MATSRKNTPAKRKPIVYYAQNRAIHEARRQLGLSLDDVRLMAGALNLDIASISRLNLTQRHALIERLNAMGARVRNPQLTEHDVAEEKGKIVRFPALSSAQIKMLDALAAQVTWKEADGYLRLCYKYIQAPEPRNGREVNRIKQILLSLLRQQQKRQQGVPTSDAHTHEV